MCGRYYVDEEMGQELEKVVRGADRKIYQNFSGDIHPSDQAVVLTGKKQTLSLDMMNWGFPQYQKKGLVINARAETSLEKKMFRSNILYRRCIIPACHYYEWDVERNKVIFRRKDSPIIYFAGFYNLFEKERFVILTTQANDSVRKIHDRMPLILESNEIEAWIYDDSFFQYALKKIPVQLERNQKYEQMSLFDFFP